MMQRWMRLARKAWHRPPAALVRGVQREVRRQIGRPWTAIRARRFDDRAFLSATGVSTIDDLWERLVARPFFVSPSTLPETARLFQQVYPRHSIDLIASADAAVAHRFDLLGSGPVTFDGELPWHDDFKVGRRWPIRYAPDIEFEYDSDQSDVKVPWELSRCQHFTALGLAYRLTGDSTYAAEFVAEIDDWIGRNPWNRGVNWICAMDVALRAISWIWGLYLFENAGPCASPVFRARFLRALYLHGEFIIANLEKADVNGNHYLCDGVGLVFLGSLFGDTRAGRRWLDRGRQIVVDEMPRQVHEDGVDFEKAIAYHRLVLEGFLTAYLLLQRQGKSIPSSALDRLHRMFEFVAAYTGPDGSAPLIGDADDGRIQRLGTQPLSDHRYLLSTGAVLFKDARLRAGAGTFWDESFWLLGPKALAVFEALDPRPCPSTAFSGGGFYVMRHDASHVIIDCGEVGMGGRGGHGHNDILSFELVLDGTRVLTDCGSYVYTASREWRNRFRSTAMHNTVQVDGAEINRFISPNDLWRLRDDARPVDVCWRPSADHDYFRGAHTGYDREPHRIRHVREMVLDHEAPLVFLRDRLTGAGRHEFTWRFHFVPGAVLAVEESSVRARIGGRDVWLSAVESPPGAAWRIESSWVSPRYGIKLESTVAIVTWIGEAPSGASFVFGLTPLTLPDASALMKRFEIRQ